MSNRVQNKDMTDVTLCLGVMKYVIPCVEQ